MVKRSTLLLLGLMIAVGIPVQAETLSWKFEGRKGWRVAMDQSVESVTLIRGKPIKMNVRVQMEMDWNVMKVHDDGSADIEQRPRRVQVRLETSSIQPVIFDSSKTPTTPAGKALGETLSPFLMGTFSVRMAADGSITKTSTSLAEEKQEASALSVESIQHALKQATLILPKKSLGKDDSWTAKSTQKASFGEVSVDNTYTFRGPSKEQSTVSEIAVEGKLQLKGSKSRLKRQSQKGLIKFSHADGYLLSSELRQELELSSQRRGQVLETKSTSTVKVQLTPQ